MKILITGGNGYIAKSLFKNLNNSILITRKDFDLTDRDVTNKWFDGKYFDVVIHTAIKGGSRLSKDNSDTFYQNIQMFYNLLNNKHCFGKLINFGSGAELGMPTDPYGLSKNIISKLINSEPHFYNIRIFGVFDENELNTRFIKNNINRYIKKESILIHQNKIMDFFYMRDLIKLVEYYVDNEYLPKEIDCKYSNSFSLKEIAHMINNLNNYQVNIEIDNQEEGISYIGNYVDLNIDYVGLQGGIKEIYNNLISKKILNG